MLFLFLSSCGFEAKYSLKNRATYAFTISEFNLTGDRKINLKIKQMLNNYRKPNIKNEKDFILEIFSESEKITTSKNASGNATKFKNQIKLNVQVSLNGKFESEIKIIENFIYDNNLNTFDLKTYEGEIKNNLTEIAINKLLSKLATSL